MSGRGIFTIKIEETNALVKSNSSEEASNRDSGLGTRSPVSTGEYRRLGRGKLLDDLTSSCSNISISVSRGRACLLKNIKDSNNVKENESHYERTEFGRGRQQVFQYHQAIENSESERPTKKESGDKEEGNSSSPLFYCPNDIRGKKGSPVYLAANYIQLTSDPKKGVYMYEVRFSPKVDSVKLRMEYLNEHREKFGGTKTFDGVTLYLPILLKDKLTTFLSKSQIGDTVVEIRILYKKKEVLKNCTHLYNVLFDRVMKTLNYVRFDRKQFDPSAPKVIPHCKLEVWPGYVTAVDEYDGGLMLCCDVSHRLLCQKTVLEMLIEIYGSNPKQIQENAKKSLLGSVVMTRYNNRTYRIDDISFDKTPLSTFQTKNGVISYFDYYRLNHHIDIKDKEQPLLISIKRHKGSESPDEFVFCLIPELCFLTGLRDDMRSDFKLMREIATFTRVTPNQRMQALYKFYTNINNCLEAREILQNWGLSLLSSNKYVQGRQLEEEQINFAKKYFPAGTNADFSRYAGNNELLDVIHLRNWLIIHCKTDSKITKSFFEHMDRNANILGIKVCKAEIIVLENDKSDTYVQALRKNVNRDTQIVVCICPTSRDDRYSAIKKVCCAEIPIPSQVINAKTLSNETKNKSIVQKIALQINCKLGGSLWAVKIPFKNVMICGIDSYHDPIQKGNSVSAFVASLNCTYTKWFSKAVIQTKREEIVNGLCSSLKAAMQAFQKENGKFPNNIIIYRDGVGDGQLQICSNYEIPQLEAACLELFSVHMLKITFIVVQKRIHTRYFIVKGNNTENPLPGTIVDNCITRKNVYDFFLVSQSVRQGTVSPTHFIVLRDDAFYSPDIIQRLSYKLCFLYYNWPGTIRIPACCQYAHKMAYLIGQSICRTTSEELSNKLFYL